MTNLDLYAKSEHLLGIEEATEALHNLYRSELEEKNVKTLLDIGCGRGGFMKMMQQEGVTCKGIDQSALMVEACKQDGLDVEQVAVKDVAGKYDAIVCIFDVINFMDKDELLDFLDGVASKLNDEGVFIADINTLHGFSDVAEGTMSNEDENAFLCVDAAFGNSELHTKFTLFEKESDGRFTKYQDTIVQYFHKIQLFTKLPSLKLVDKQTFSLYDEHDKALLIFAKRV